MAYPGVGRHNFTVQKSNRKPVAPVGSLCYGRDIMRVDPRIFLDPLRLVAVTCLIGFAGAGLATLAGLPAAALIGSAVTVSLVTWGGLKTRMAEGLRNAAFGVIGVSLGAGFTPDVIGQMAAWPASLGLLLASVATTMTAATLLLMRGFGMGRDTALLASSPGALSYAIALAATGRGDAVAVLVVQGLRLLLIATTLPLLLTALGGPPAEALRPALTETTGPAVTLALLALTGVFGWAGLRRGWPAAFLLAGMATSGILHAVGLVEGRPPGWLTFAGFTITGAAIGARFSGVETALLRRHAVAALAVTLLASGIAAGFAALAAGIVGIPFTQAWIAFAPGGIEAMAVMALSLGFDPAFVATHHVARLLILFALLPVLMKRLS